MNRSKIKRVINNPRVVLIRLLYQLSTITHCNSEQYLKVLYRVCTGRKLHLDNPRTFTEKLQYLKLYVNITPECTQMADKYGVRSFIKDKIGEDYLIPMLGVWDQFDDIDFGKLPQQFVLKTTHDSGGVVICHDKSKLDLHGARRLLNRHLKHNYYWEGRETPYKNIKPRIVAEKLMIDESGYDLKDYKLFCFDGIPKILFLASERFDAEGKMQVPKFTYYDMDLNILPIRSKGHDIKRTPPSVPNWEEMKYLAGILSKGKPFLRVDFYNINGRIYFGELTFHHDGGLVPFEPEEWDMKLGDMINLPQII